MIDFASFTTVYNREIRAWRHRFWWLPLAGVLACLLPLSIAPPERDAVFPAPTLTALEDSNATFLDLPVSQTMMAWVVGGLCAVTSLLALWLAREFRGAEVRNGTLLDVALTSLRPFEFVIAQIGAAWTVSAMLLVGALPVVLPMGVRVGMTPGELAWGVTLLLLAPLIGACLGYGALWWRRGVTLASRGHSLRLWLIPYVMVVFASATACGAFVTYPIWKKFQSDLSPAYRSQTYLTDALLANFFIGIALLAWLYAAFIVARWLWRAGWKGRLALLLFLPCVTWLAWKTPTFGADWMEKASEYFVGPYSGQAMTAFYLLPAIAPVNAITACGGSPGLSSDERALFHAPNWLTLSGLAYWLGFGLLAFLSALDDVRWVMRQPWLISALQRPETAPFMLEWGDGRFRRRKGFYVFGTRNPIYDYLLARSSGSRITLTGWFALLVVGVTGAVSFFWNDYVHALPETYGMSDDVLGITWGVAVGLCALCGLNAGATISQLKASQQWSALLSLPLKPRALFWAVCLPCVVDALLIAVLALSLCGMGVGLHFANPKAFMPYAVAMGIALFVSLATSLFASAFTKGTAKAMVLSVILSALLLVGLIWLETWLDTHFTVAGMDDASGSVSMEFLPVFNAPAPTIEWWHKRSFLTTSAIGTAILLFLGWWGVRRLKRER